MAIETDSEEPEVCKADGDTSCDCPACDAEFERRKAYWLPLWKGEVAAGLIRR